MKVILTDEINNQINSQISVTVMLQSLYREDD